MQTGVKAGVEDYLETSRKTRESIVRQGWCLWKCRLFNNETILVIEDYDIFNKQLRLNDRLLGVIGYPRYSLEELHILATAEESTAQLIHEAKKFFAARLISVEEVKTGGTQVVSEGT